MGLFDQWFTLVIIPDRTTRVIRIKIPKTVLIAGSALVVSLLAFGGYTFVHSLELGSRLDAFRELESKQNSQKIAFKRISNEMDSLKGEMSRLRELDYKLRVITDLEVEKPSPPTYGIGGSLESGAGLTLENADQSKLDLVAMLDKDLARLREMADYQEESFNNLKAYLSDQKDLIERTPHRWPVHGFISSSFGPRLDPFTGLTRLHEGIDIVARRGSPVAAPADGIVTYTGVDPTLGDMVVIDHGYGVLTRYGHNDTVLVREGQRVKRGDAICTVGTSGKSTGPHLHYEIRLNDIAVNPLNYLVD
jgi:murein DD-endopeptidase MepM/ murein hydrolase activator NlpD